VVYPVTITELERDDQGIIIVWARLEGPNGSRDLQLALDTGAAMTLVVPEVLDRLGYGARDGDKITSISAASAAPEQGYRLRVRHFQALGFGFHHFRIHAHELPDYGVDGLLGMDFLEKFDFEVRMSEQRIRLAPAGSDRTA
jgi:predicted aspartyl protease